MNARQKAAKTRWADPAERAAQARRMRHFWNERADKRDQRERVALLRANHLTDNGRLEYGSKEYLQRVEADNQRRVIQQSLNEGWRPELDKYHRELLQAEADLAAFIRDKFPKKLVRKYRRKVAKLQAFIRKAQRAFAEGKDGLRSVRASEAQRVRWAKADNEARVAFSERVHTPEAIAKANDTRARNRALRAPTEKPEPKPKGKRGRPKGWVMPLAVRAKISAKLSGRSLTDSTRSAISAASQKQPGQRKRGRPKGHKLTPEQKRNLSEAVKLAWFYRKNPTFAPAAIQRHNDAVAAEEAAAARARAGKPRVARLPTLIADLRKQEKNDNIH